MKRQAGPASIGDLATLRLRAGLETPIEMVLLRTCPDGEQRFTPMSPEAQPSDRQVGCCWWQVTIRLTQPVTAYRFLILTRDGPWWYNGSGLHRYVPTDAEDFRLLAGYAAPSWVKDSVFYQIFPDRFANGDARNDVREAEFVYRGEPAHARAWGEPPSASGPAAMVEFFGGDLPGIEQRLNYLADLGVNALYLNPVFAAFSNHRYDVVDYYQVDPHLGGDAALASLRQASRERGLRLILDIVPNHCGSMHPWFQAALADPHTPTAEYFTFHHHPDDYACWLGVRSLPKLNYRSEALRKAMYAGPDSVFRYWMRSPFSIDGWRLDVANMLARQGETQLGLEVGRGIRQAVKSENPQAYLLGENFFDASEQLQGDVWDAVMNYSGFSKPLLYWLSHFQVRQHGDPRLVTVDAPWSTQALVDTWQAYRASIPWEIASQQFNLLGSHDTARILTVVGGDSRLNRLAAGLLLTYPGVPCVYYGDEVGLLGAESESRGCMPWDPQVWDPEMRLFYQALIHLRRNSTALSEGGFQVLAVEENMLAYLRDAEAEQVVVVAQRGPGTRPPGALPVGFGGIPDGTLMEEVLSGRQAVVAGGYLPLAALPPGIEIWRTRAGG